MMEMEDWNALCMEMEDWKDSSKEGNFIFWLFKMSESNIMTFNAWWRKEDYPLIEVILSLIDDKMLQEIKSTEMTEEKVEEYGDSIAFGEVIITFLSNKLGIFSDQGSFCDIDFVFVGDSKRVDSDLIKIHQMIETIKLLRDRV